MSLIEGPFAELPAYKPGRMIVAAGPKGLIALADGARLTWGERVFGGYRSFYLVIMSVQPVNLSFSVASARPAVSFEAAVTLTLRIRHAVAAVERNLSDPQIFLGTAVRKCISDVAKRYEVGDAVAAARAAEATLQALCPDDAIELIDVVVDLRADAEAQKHLRTVSEASLKAAASEARARHDEFQRVEMLKAIASPDELLAQYLVTKDETFRNALQHKLDQAANEQQRRIEIMRVLVDGKVIEPHDFERFFPDFLKDAVRSFPALGVGGAAALSGPSKVSAASTTDDQSTDER